MADTSDTDTDTIGASLIHISLAHNNVANVADIAIQHPNAIVDKYASDVPLEHTLKTVAQNKTHSAQTVTFNMKAPVRIASTI